MVSQCRTRSIPSWLTFEFSSMTICWLWSYYSPQPSRPRKAKRQTRLLGQTQGSTCRFKVLRSFKYLKMPPGIKHLKYQISRNITWQSDSGRPSPWLRTRWNPHLRNVNVYIDVCHLFIVRPDPKWWKHNSTKIIWYQTCEIWAHPAFAVGTQEAGCRTQVRPAETAFGWIWEWSKWIQTW